MCLHKYKKKTIGVLSVQSKLIVNSKPTVLKYVMPVVAKDSASSGVVITTAIGKPFPIGLPSVTMSGTTPTEMHGYDLAYCCKPDDS